MKSYSIDSTSIDSVKNKLYFRLPQNEVTKSIIEPELFRFQWENIPILDVDTDASLNINQALNLYYRLELMDLFDNRTYILEDSIEHSEFINQEYVWADIAINSNELFQYYYDSNIISSSLDSAYIDISGLNSYKWRVIAQNYWRDELGIDPVQISSNWENTHFKIDLITPEITYFNIIADNLFPRYLDVLWNSSEILLEDFTLLNQYIYPSEKTDRLYVREIDNNFYTATGVLDIDQDSSSYLFDFTLRDEGLNSKDTSYQVNYFIMNPDSQTLLYSPSELAVIKFSESEFYMPTGILIHESNNIARENITRSNYIQLTPAVHILSAKRMLNEPAVIKFYLDNYLSDEFVIWKCVIMQISDGLISPLLSSYTIDEISANIHELGTFAIYLDLDITEPLPIEFKLYPNYPNPFNSTTIIPLAISDESYVKVTIFNILGQLVFVLLDDIQKPGYIDLKWDGTNQVGQPLSTGIYLLQVQNEQNTYTKKMMLIK